MKDRLEAVIFDMGGTLVDIEGLKADSYREALKKYGVSNGDEWYYRHVGLPGKPMTELVVKELNLPIMPKQFRMLRQLIYEVLLENSKPQGIPPTITFLRTIPRHEYKIGMATSEHIKDINRYLADINVHPNNFDAIVSADEVKNDKPAPDVYLLCAEKLRVKPRNCLAIEDSTAGIESAKSAGMICIAQNMPHNRFLDLSRADLVVDAFSQLQLRQLEECFFK